MKPDLKNLEQSVQACEQRLIGQIIEGAILKERVQLLAQGQTIKPPLYTLANVNVFDLEDAFKAGRDAVLELIGDPR